MNFSDIFVVIILVTALHAMIVAMAGKRNFLAKAVNPHRGTWFIASLSLAWVGISLLRWESQNWSLSDWSQLLTQLVTDAPTPPRVKVATMCIYLSGVFLFLVGTCVFFLPRDPSTFHRPGDRGKAFHYYVSRLKDGLDYALLAHGDGEILEEAVHVKQIELRSPYLPKVPAIDGPGSHLRGVDEQVANWRKLAQTIHERMSDLDDLVECAQQGRNQGVMFDTDFGGCFFVYLRAPDLIHRKESGLYLFGATINEGAMSRGTTEDQFRLLLSALKHIDRSIRAA